MKSREEIWQLLQRLEEFYERCNKALNDILQRRVELTPENLSKLGVGSCFVQVDFGDRKYTVSCGLLECEMLDWINALRWVLELPPKKR